LRDRSVIDAGARPLPSLGVPKRQSCRAFAAVVLCACNPKITTQQCDALLGRYSQLVVNEKYPDASATDLSVEEQREKREARGDDAFKNCSSEVSQSEFLCAMGAATADALEKCLE
jgi:hypothetical protein